MNTRNFNGRFLSGIHYSPNTEFKKGQKLPQKIRAKMEGRRPWNKGKKCPQLTGSLNGFFKLKHSESSLEKNRIAHLGKKPNEKQKAALAYGRLLKRGKPAPWARKNPQVFKPGKAHPMWSGGSKSWRGENWKRIKKKVWRRDEGRCRRCGNTEKLSVHHLVPYRILKDNSLKNLELLCRRCHAIADWEYVQKKSNLKSGVKT